MRVLFPLLLGAALLLSSLVAIAMVDIYAFDTESQRERYQQLSEELRCPKCQNQNLAGSDSQIAGDLRRELHRLLLEGQSDPEIKEYMVARYGDFVLYKPPLQQSTLVLWGLPFMMLLIGAVVSLFIVKHRRAKALSPESVDVTHLSDSEASALDDLLTSSPSTIDNVKDTSS